MSMAIGRLLPLERAAEVTTALSGEAASGSFFGSRLTPAAHRRAPSGNACTAPDQSVSQRSRTARSCSSTSRS